MLLSTLKEMPPRGSVQESVLILVYLKQEEVQHARIRALSQILIDKDKGVEAFEQYMNAAFPWVISAQKKDRQSQIDKLMGEVKQGAMSVKPLWQKKINSRLKNRVVSSPLTNDQHKRADDLLKKIGSVIPT